MPVTRQYNRTLTRQITSDNAFFLHTFHASIYVRRYINKKSK